MEKQQKRLSRKEWEEENRKILERLKKEGKLPKPADVEEALRKQKEEKS